MAQFLKQFWNYLGSLLKNICFGVKQILCFDCVAPLDNSHSHRDGPLYVFNQNLSRSFSRLFQNPTALSQNHSHLNIVSHVNLVVNPDFPTELWHPRYYLNSSLVGYLLEVLFHDSLFESFLSPLDRAFVTYHPLVVSPWTFFCLVQ